MGSFACLLFFEIGSFCLPRLASDSWLTMFVATLLLTARNWKQPRHPSTEEHHTILLLLVIVGLTILPELCSPLPLWRALLSILLKVDVPVISDFHLLLTNLSGPFFFKYVFVSLLNHTVWIGNIHLILKNDFHPLPRAWEFFPYSLDTMFFI